MMKPARRPLYCATYKVFIRTKRPYRREWLTRHINALFNLVRKQLDDDGYKHISIEPTDVFAAWCEIRESEPNRLIIQHWIKGYPDCLWADRGLGKCSDDVTCGHVIAASKGGALTLENTWPECSSHNFARGPRTVEEYLASSSPKRTTASVVDSGSLFPLFKRADRKAEASQMRAAVCPCHDLFTASPDTGEFSVTVSSQDQIDKLNLPGPWSITICPNWDKPIEVVTVSVVGDKRHLKCNACSADYIYIRQPIPMADRRREQEARRQAQIQSTQEAERQSDERQQAGQAERQRVEEFERQWNERKLVEEAARQDTAQIALELVQRQSDEFFDLIDLSIPILKKIGLSHKLIPDTARAEVFGKLSGLHQEEIKRLVEQFNTPGRDPAWLAFASAVLRYFNLVLEDPNPSTSRGCTAPDDDIQFHLPPLLPPPGRNGPASLN